MQEPNSSGCRFFSTVHRSPAEGSIQVSVLPIAQPMVRTPSLAHSASTSTSCSAHSSRVQHLSFSMRLPVMASICMQYLVSGVPGGAGAGAGYWFAAQAGEAARTMLQATTNALCAMSFLLDDNAGVPTLARVSLRRDLNLRMA